MNENFIEGFLQLKIDGYWYIDHYKLKQGTLFEIFKENEWYMVSMEESQGAFYCLPLNLLTEGDKVRIEVDL